jgi:hypothetical protein
MMTVTVYLIATGLLFLSGVGVCAWIEAKRCSKP